MFEEDANQLSRRSFFAVTLSATLSKLFIAPSTPVAVLAIPVGVNTAEVERIRRLCGTPLQWFEPVRTLMWTELPTTEGDAPRLMIWTPETPGEHAEADRFFGAATWRSWSSDVDLSNLLRGSNKWLIRLRLIGGLCLFAAWGEADMPASADDIDLTPDPANAAVVSAAQARTLIALLNSEWSIEPDNWMYFEPVQPEQALADPRWNLLRATE